MRRILFLLLPLVLLFVAARTPVPQTADEVIEKHLGALGGRDALTKLTSRKATGTVTVSTPNGDISGPFESYAKQPNKSRVHMALDASALGAGTIEIEQRFDGTSGTLMNSMSGAADMPAAQADNLRNALFPTPLLTVKDRGVKTELQPREKVGGKDAIVVLVTPKSGSAVRMFIDAETFLLVKTITTVTTEAGTLEQSSELSDYRTVDGVKVPFQIVNKNAVQTVTIKLSTVTHNVAIDDAMFGR